MSTTVTVPSPSNAVIMGGELEPPITRWREVIALALRVVALAALMFGFIFDSAEFYVIAALSGLGSLGFYLNVRYGPDDNWIGWVLNLICPGGGPERQQTPLTSQRPLTIRRPRSTGQLGVRRQLVFASTLRLSTIEGSPSGSSVRTPGEVPDIRLADL